MTFCKIKYSVGKGDLKTYLGGGRGVLGVKSQSHISGECIYVIVSHSDIYLNRHYLSGPYPPHP